MFSRFCKNIDILMKISIIKSVNKISKDKLNDMEKRIKTVRGLNSVPKEDLTLYLLPQIAQLPVGKHWVSANVTTFHWYDLLEITAINREYIYWGKLNGRKFPCPLINVEDVKMLNCGRRTSKISALILKRKKGPACSITSFWGEQTPAIPGNSGACPESETFWRKHCLVVHKHDKVEETEAPEWA